MTVEVQGLDDVVRRIEGLDSPEVFRRPMIQSVEHIRDVVSEYPPESHRPQPFKTDKQRRYFFWALREGIIEVPYRRGQSPGSEDLGPSWTTQVSPDGRRGVVGNDTTYGPYVQGRQQSAYHAETGWKTTDRVAREEQDEVAGFFEAQYRRYAAQ